MKADFLPSSSTVIPRLNTKPYKCPRISVAAQFNRHLNGMLDTPFKCLDVGQRYNMDSSKIEPEIKHKSGTRFPWVYVLRWLVLGYGVVSFVSFSLFMIQAGDALPITTRMFFPGLQFLFLVGGVLLVLRPRQALYAAVLFSGHLIVAFGHTYDRYPTILFTSEYVVKWLISIGSVALSLYVFYCQRRIRQK
ncbi:hypothetical protein LCGC14_0063750 [marine sediment metagenome]|uniref:Uncharacterized protein n=1 Tax=marine sediment metagenome TaxID=412755 RepID=A0A0F9Y3V6_9ZZZZ